MEGIYPTACQGWQSKATTLSLTLTETVLWQWQQVAQDQKIEDNATLVAFLVRHYLQTRVGTLHSKDNAAQTTSDLEMRGSTVQTVVNSSPQHAGGVMIFTVDGASQTTSEIMPVTDEAKQTRDDSLQTKGGSLGVRNAVMQTTGEVMQRRDGTQHSGDGLLQAAEPTLRARDAALQTSIAMQTRGNIVQTRGDTVQMRGDTVQVRGDTVQMRGNTVQMRGDTVPMRGDTAQMRGDTVQMRGDTVPIRGDTVQMRGDTVHVRGDSVQMRGDTVQMRGDTVQMRGDTVQVRGDTVQMRGDTVQMRGDTVQTSVCSSCSSPLSVFCPHCCSVSPRMHQELTPLPTVLQKESICLDPDSQRTALPWLPVSCQPNRLQTQTPLCRTTSPAQSLRLSPAQISDLKEQRVILQGQPITACSENSHPALQTEPVTLPAQPVTACSENSHPTLQTEPVTLPAQPVAACSENSHPAFQTEPVTLPAQPVTTCSENSHSALQIEPVKLPAQTMTTSSRPALEAEPVESQVRVMDTLIPTLPITQDTVSTGSSAQTNINSQNHSESTADDHAAEYDNETDEECYPRVTADDRHAGKVSIKREYQEKADNHLRTGKEKVIDHLCAGVTLPRDDDAGSKTGGCGCSDIFTCRVCLRIFCSRDKLIVHEEAPHRHLVHQRGECKAGFFGPETLVLRVNPHGKSSKPDFRKRSSSFFLSSQSRSGRTTNAASIALSPDSSCFKKQPQRHDTVPAAGKLCGDLQAAESESRTSESSLVCGISQTGVKNHTSVGLVNDSFHPSLGTGGGNLNGVVSDSTAAWGGSTKGLQGAGLNPRTLWTQGKEESAHEGAADGCFAKTKKAAPEMKGNARDSASWRGGSTEQASGHEHGGVDTVECHDSCQLCGASFTQPQNLVSHANTRCFPSKPFTRGVSGHRDQTGQSSELRKGGVDILTHCLVSTLQRAQNTEVPKQHFTRSSTQSAQNSEISEERWTRSATESQSAQISGTQQQSTRSATQSAQISGTQQQSTRSATQSAKISAPHQQSTRSATQSTQSSATHQQSTRSATQCANISATHQQSTRSVTQSAQSSATHQQSRSATQCAQISGTQQQSTRSATQSAQSSATHQQSTRSATQRAQNSENAEEPPTRHVKRSRRRAAASLRKEKAQRPRPAVKEVTTDNPREEDNISYLTASEIACPRPPSGASPPSSLDRQQDPVAQSPDRHVCPLCGARFASSFLLTGHLQVHAGQRGVKCSLCDVTCQSTAQLKSHVRSHNAQTAVKDYPCQYCGKVLRSLYTLREHQRSHTGDRPFQCGLCGAGFTLSSTYHAHQRTHTGDRPYLCPHCGKSFVRSSNLSVHIRACTGQKPYACAVCGKSFSDVGYYRKHINNHAGIRPYKCEYCGKAFAQSTSLKLHIRTHTGEKPHQCGQCSMAFAVPNSLRQHMRRHTGDRPFKCSLCGKAFAKSCNRLAHFRTHSKVKVAGSPASAAPAPARPASLPLPGLSSQA